MTEPERAHRAMDIQLGRLFWAVAALVLAVLLVS